jgi:hypothetical protein
MRASALGSEKAAVALPEDGDFLIACDVTPPLADRNCVDSSEDDC